MASRHTARTGRGCSKKVKFIAHTYRHANNRPNPLIPLAYPFGMYKNTTNANQGLKHPKRDRGSNSAKDMDNESLS
jgi:hypothetical protein